MFSAVSSHFTVHYLTMILRNQKFNHIYAFHSLVSYLTKLRISAHQLYVELVDIVTLPFLEKKRFCFHCKHIVEDEKHFYLIVFCINMSEKNIKIT